MGKSISILDDIDVKFDKPENYNTIRFVMESHNRIFERKNAPVAQMVERETENLCVDSSKLSRSTK